MEDIASNQDNPPNVTVTLTAARVSVLPLSGYHVDTPITIKAEAKP